MTSTTISFRTDKEIKQDLEAAAERFGETVADILNELSMDFLKKLETKDPELYSKLHINSENFKRTQIIELTREIGKWEAREITYPQRNTNRLKEEIRNDNSKNQEQKAKEIRNLDENAKIRLAMAEPIIESKRKQLNKMMEELDEIIGDKLAKTLDKLTSKV